MSIKHLEPGEVVAMHDVALARYGGAAGGGHRGISYAGVEAAVEAVRNSYYDDLPILAAAYAVYIVQGHVFMDGNKRTAAMAATTFLQYNGVEVVLSDEEIFEIMFVMQEKSEEGERVDALIAWVAQELTS
jgi:death-on-curing protein